MKILEHPHPVLREKCRLVEPREFGTTELSATIAGMLDLLRERNGAGLAAPQIGQPIRLFVVAPGIIPCHVQDSLDMIPTVVINPSIIPDESAIEYGEEGCLSIPHARYRVRRNRRIQMTWQSVDGMIHTSELDGWEARVCQHEEDHLHGTLILDIGRPVR